MFDYKKYKFGMLIPTYGLPADPLEYDCLSGYEVWDSPNCGQRTSAKPINKGKWHDIMHHLNLYSHDSSMCHVHYDLTGNNETFFDH